MGAVVFSVLARTGLVGAVTAADAGTVASAGWACPPTHVPWTSGSLYVKPDLATKWVTGGGWGNMRIHQLGADGTPIEASCTRNQGRECDPKVLGHAG